MVFTSAKNNKHKHNKHKHNKTDRGELNTFLQTSFAGGKNIRNV